MALSVSQTLALSTLLKPGMKVASMGYPDLIAPIADIPGLKYRDDSEAICKRHGLQLRRIPDAESYFSLKGCKLDVFDIVKELGCEILCDLNEDNNLWYHIESYDIVLDVGTCEHVFAVSNAIKNMAKMVKEGGWIIHENPFNQGNHGFYNLNPTFYNDFYTANGFKVIDCRLVSRDGRSLEVPLGKRFRFFAEEVNTFAVAQRVSLQSFVNPTQAKYAALVAGVDRALGAAHG